MAWTILAVAVYIVVDVLLMAFFGWLRGRLDGSGSVWKMWAERSGLCCVIMLWPAAIAIIPLIGMMALYDWMETRGRNV